MTDTEMLNWLEQFVASEPLTLWDGVGEYPGSTRGVGLSFGHTRTLREAIRQAAGKEVS